VSAIREATAFLLLPVVLAVIVLLPAWVYLVAVWAVSLLAAAELLAILRRVHPPTPLWPPLLLLAAALPALWALGLAASGPVLAAVVLLLPLVHLLTGRPVAGAGGAIAAAVFAAVYFAVTGGAMGLLRTSFAGAYGWKILLTHCLTIWGGDSGAYYVGTYFGRHRLAPVVSPKKSWEGIVGGTALSFFAVWVCRTVFFPELPTTLGLAVAALLSVLAPLGDLAESLFKRDAGLKDSSLAIPGHGGFLDRTDSLFFAAPFVLALFLLVRPTW